MRQESIHGKLRAMILVGALLVIDSSIANALDTSNWYPLRPGYTWNYRELATGASYTERVNAVNVGVNGYTATQLVDSDGDSSYETHDALGHRLYRLVATEMVVELAQTLTITTNFDPPVQLLPGQFAVGGIPASSSGTATMLIPGYGNYRLQYNVTSRLEGTEAVHIGGSTVNAYKVVIDLTLSGQVSGQYLSTTDTYTTWFQPGVGPVRMRFRDDGMTTDEWQLTSTSFTTFAAPGDADLRVESEVIPRHGVVGEMFKIRVRAHNLGPANATIPVVQIRLPSGMWYHGTLSDGTCQTDYDYTTSSWVESCSWASLAPGDTGVVETDMTGPSERTYNLSATISADGGQTDPSAANNQSTLEIYVNRPSIASGDLAPIDNPDGVVNVGDALVALRYAMGMNYAPSPTSLKFGDVSPMARGRPTPDGKLTISDALMILRKAMGVQNF